jgi:hypothetical protein
VIRGDNQPVLPSIDWADGRCGLGWHHRRVVVCC